MESVKQIKDAYALPERTPYYEIRKKRADGTVLVIPHFRDLVAIELEDDTILCFQDKDGRLMEIGYSLNGAYKYPVS